MNAKKKNVKAAEKKIKIYKKKIQKSIHEYAKQR